MSNQHLIRSISSEIRIKPALVAGTLASEMLFDYGWTDEWSDATLLWSPNGGYGYANAHASARESAANYLLPLFGEGQVGVIPRSVVGTEADVARWLTTAEGAIYASAIVGRWLVDAFTSNIGVGYERALSLSAQEMAVIWAGYRAGVGGMDANIPSTSVGFENIDEWRDTARSTTLPCNAQIALPLMERMNIIFS
jgi:hypothetical protein